MFHRNGRERSTKITLNCVLLSVILGASILELHSQDPVQTPLRLEVALPDYRLEFFPRVFAPGQRPLVLALGGGGAKGIAHAGVLQRFQEEGIPISGIAGTSMGAFIGSMYANGYSGFAIQTLLEKVDVGALLLDRQHRSPGVTLWEQENERITFLSLNYKPGAGFAFSPGTSSGLDLKRVLQILLSRSSFPAAKSFDELRVPFRAVSSNLQTGRAVAPVHGELATAVRASMSIPGLFNPVVMDGDQHVDGMLVQNLPVETARGLGPGAVVLAIEVGANLEAARQNSILGVAVRALDVSIEERTGISRRAADLLIRPDTDKIPHLEFHKQVSAAVQAGRRAFDGGLDTLEGLLYGLDGASPAPGGTVTVIAPAPLHAQIQALAEGSLPPGPRLRRHYLRLLRRLHAAGLVQWADLRFTPEGPVLDAEPYPVLHQVEVKAPEEWLDLLKGALDEAHLETGAVYNPMALGRVLDTFFLLATLQGHPFLSAEGTTFDPAKGVLHLKITERFPESIHVREGILSRAQTTYIRNLLRPFEGHAFDARDFTRRLLLAEKRLGLEELRVTADPEAPKPTIVASPVPDDRITVDGVLAYESTWHTHGAVSLRTNRLFGSDFGLGLQASANRLRDAAELELSRVLGGWPRLGWRMSASQTQHRFLPESLRTPFELSSFALILADRSLRERSLGLGVFARIGMDDRGLASIDFSRRWSSLHPALSGAALPRVDQIQIMGEWDSFDRYLFPTQGTLLRVKLGQGWRRSPEIEKGKNTYQFAYARVRNLWSLGPWASLEGDLEAGLGWDLPLSRWYSVGGPSFLAGTPSAGFLTPNFALARLGLPMRVMEVFGMNLQVVPRLDAGYLGGLKPGQLRDGAIVRGLGIALRSEIGRWYCEVALGRWFTSDIGAADKTRINVLLGAHPFDLWRER